MELLPGFSWPVPRAFASAVAVCRFEQGDVFYDSPAGYERWAARGPKGLSRWVQVLDPPRSARGVPADAEGNRFAVNWASPVSLRIGSPGAPAAEPVRCTQGRLFSCLWRGAPGLLVDEAAEDPPLPRGARELQKQLELALPEVRAAIGGRKRVLFVGVVDESSESSLAKRRAIETALAARYRPETICFAPAEAGVPAGDDYHPALRIHASAVPAADAEPVRELLKRALYAPTRTGSEAGSDRFKLERHGLLVAGDAPVHEEG